MFKGHNCLMIVGEIIVFIHKKMFFRSRDIKISKPKYECIRGVMPSVWAHGNIHSLKEKKSITFNCDINFFFISLVVTLERRDKITSNSLSLAPIFAVTCSSLLSSYLLCNAGVAVALFLFSIAAYSHLLSLCIPSISYKCYLVQVESLSQVCLSCLMAAKIFIKAAGSKH